MIDLRQITIRGIPDEIEKTIKKEAKRKGLSLNKAFISLLEKKTGIGAKEKRKKVLHHDLDHLFGVWTNEEAESFKRNLDFQRKIDEDLWKKTG